MQQPRLRFKGFNDDWKESNLNKIANKVTSKNIKNKYYEVLTNSAVNGIIKQRNFFSKSIANNDNTDRYTIINPNDYMYNPRISNLAPYGPVRRNKLNEVGIASPMYLVFKVNGSCDLQFIDEYFNTDKWYSYVYSQGNTGVRSDRIAIKDNDFMCLPITMPNLAEQTKIGEFFNRFDKLIELQSSKLEHLKRLKNGYLQKMFTSGNVPRLRFKGFNDKWKNKKLISILSDSNGIKRGPFGSSLKKSDFIKESNYVVYEQRNAIYNQFHTRYNISQEKYNDLNQFHLYYGDFIMSGSGTIGKISRVPQKIKKGVFNQALIRIKINEHVNSSYFLQFMRSNLMQRKIKANNPGSAMQNLRPIREIKNINITIPLLSEQTQMGHFFNLLDKQINLANKKLASLQQDKKAYLQKMFI